MDTSSAEKRALARIQRKISDALHGVVVADVSPYALRGRTYCRTTEPPSYLPEKAMRIAFPGHVEGRVEKIDWAISLSFEGHVWAVSDWKRTEWNVRSQSGGRAGASRLTAKIKAAANIVDHYLSTQAQRLFTSDEFALQNQYWRHWRLYKHFYDQTTAALAQPEHGPPRSMGIPLTGRNLHVPDIAGIINDHVGRNREIEAAAAAMVVFFFSWAEVLLDCCYSLRPSVAASYRELHSKDWLDRFKAIFPEAASHSDLFQQLSYVRREHRNALVHSSPVFFFAAEGIGLIPATYNDFGRPRMRYPIDDWDKEAAFCQDVFERTIAFFEREPSIGRFALEYARSELPIYVCEEWSEWLRDRLDDFDAFRAEVNRRADYQDALQNMDA